jgi:hypothetical protein
MIIWKELEGVYKMEYKKIKNYDGEVLVPIIKVGDKIGVMFDDRYDEDFAEWCDEYKGDLIVSDIDYDDYMIWLKDCDYGVSMEIITSVNGEAVNC